MTISCRHCGRPTRTDLRAYVCPCGRSAYFANSSLYDAYLSGSTYVLRVEKPNLWQRSPYWLQLIILLLIGFVLARIVDSAIQEIFDDTPPPTMASQAFAADSCMTLSEARKKYPTQHLWKTRGCWGLGTGRPRKVRPASVPVVPQVAEANAAVTVDGNGGDTFDSFHSFRDRFITYALVDESKKADRLPLLFRAEAEPEAEPIPLPPVKPPQPAKPQVGAWLMLFAGVLFLALTSAFVISRLPSLLPLVRRRFIGGRRVINDTSTAFVTRPDYKPAPRRQRETVGSDGAGNQQPYFHSRDVYDWSGGTYERGHGNHLGPPDYRRDNTGALGAWARSRGLRAETAEGDAIEPIDIGRPRKRFAIFAWR